MASYFIDKMEKMCKFYKGHLFDSQFGYLFYAFLLMTRFYCALIRILLHFFFLFYN